ncbi:MAG TPA: RodZ domain-containing protein [Steroidobacteraceae bacterium]|jgi:cytoskeleton protein RodZ
MSVQAGGNQALSGIGTRLRAARERKGLTILQAAEKLHVDPKICESLEAENFDALGAPVYVKGHLRHYAELVGEPVTELVALYADTIRTVQPDLTRIPKAEPPSDPSRLTIPAAVVLGGFALAGAVWWVLTLSKGAVSTQTHPVASELSAAAPQQAAANVEETRGPQALPTALSAAPPPAPKAVVVAKQAPEAKSAAHPEAAAATKPGSEVTPRLAKPAELTLRFSAESWAEVYDANGDRLFYDIGPADSVKTFKGTPPMRVVLGNAPGVAVEVNGHATSLVSLTHTDGSAQFSVNRAGRTSEAHQ